MKALGTTQFAKFLSKTIRNIKRLAVWYMHLDTRTQNYIYHNKRIYFPKINLVLNRARPTWQIEN